MRNVYLIAGLLAASLAAVWAAAPPGRDAQGYGAQEKLCGSRGLERAGCDRAVEDCGGRQLARGMRPERMRGRRGHAAGDHGRWAPAGDECGRLAGPCERERQHAGRGYGRASCAGGCTAGAARSHHDRCGRRAASRHARSGRQHGRSGRGQAVQECRTDRPTGESRGTSRRGAGRREARRGGAPSGELTAAEAQALRTALLDEYAAEAYYAAILERFGPLRYIENIRRAEQRHAAALMELFTRYRLDPPARSAAHVPGVPNTLSESLAGAIEAEGRNAAMYDELLAQTRRAELRDVFESLRAASSQRHIPALSRHR